MAIEWLKRSIQHLSPVYFGLPMSTGIISIACFILGLQSASNVLFILNNIELVALSVLLLSRMVFYAKEVKKDLSTSQLGAGFLTTVAALCILGTKNVMLKNDLTIAVLGWSFTFALWLVLLYGFFILTVTNREKGSLIKGINGSWLLFVVSAQALSISGNLVASHFDYRPKLALFATTGLYLLGALFYLVLISLIFYRFVFFPMKPKEFKPSYWINMGAAAISTLAGAILVKRMWELGGYESFTPIIKIFTISFWIAGTWWIPVIVVLEIWKRVKMRVHYFPGYWSLVFPLGVYTVCTWQMADVLGLEILKNISEITVYIALLAWFITYLQMFSQIIKSFRRRHLLSRTTP